MNAVTTPHRGGVRHAIVGRNSKEKARREDPAAVMTEIVRARSEACAAAGMVVTPCSAAGRMVDEMVAGSRGALVLLRSRWAVSGGLSVV